jgi:hypothetical protein
LHAESAVKFRAHTDHELAGTRPVRVLAVLAAEIEVIVHTTGAWSVSAKRQPSMSKRRPSSQYYICQGSNDRSGSSFYCGSYRPDYGFGGSGGIFFGSRVNCPNGCLMLAVPYPLDVVGTLV